MENTNDTNPPANKDLSDFKELQEREHYIQGEDTNTQIRVTRKHCCSMSNRLKVITCALVTLVLLIAGGVFGGFYVYLKGPAFMGLVPDSYGIHSYHAILKENIDLVAEKKNAEWLWSSHSILVAIVEDDPKFLLKNDGWAWKRFQEIATTARLRGFVQVVNDGEHPNLQQWYMQDQLTQSESDPEDGVAGN